MWFEKIESDQDKSEVSKNMTKQISKQKKRGYLGLAIL